MRMLKALIIAVVCVTFTMSAACSGDSDNNNNGNPISNNNQADVGSNTDTDDSADTDDSKDSDDKTESDIADLKDTDPGETLTPELFMEQVLSFQVAVICEITFNCPENSDPYLVTNLGRTGDQAACVDYFMHQIIGDSAEPTEILASVAAGRTTFDAAKAADCLADLSAGEVACTSFDEAEMRRCIETVFIPTLEVGEACASDSECIDGHCSTSENGVCPGTCIANLPAAGEGESCEDAPCANGLECNGNSASEAICEKVVNVGAGEACDEIFVRCETGLACSDSGVCSKPIYQEKDTKCGNDTICKPGLACIGVINESWELEGTCQPVRKKDEACLFPLQCAHGLHCDSTDIDEPGKCFSLRIAGETCDDNGGDFDWCADNLECVKDDTTGESTCQKYSSDIEICEIDGE